MTATKLENVIVPFMDKTARWDIEIDGGKVTSRSPSSESCSSPPSLLLPPLCHPHIHLDKPYILTSTRTPSEAHPDYSDLLPKSGSFQEALANTSAAKRRYTPEDLYLRGSQLLADSYGRHGVTSLRAFVEVDHAVQFKTLETAVRLKKDFNHLVQVQICLFAQDPIFSGAHGDENRDLLVQALDKYAEHIEALGTTPYVEKGADADKKLDVENKNIQWAVETAIERGVHLDFHLDYNLDESRSSSMFRVISQLRTSGWTERAHPAKTIAIGHCTQLTTTDEDTFRQIQSLIASPGPALPIHFVGLPTSDLFMMGRADEASTHHHHHRPRGTLQIPSMIRNFGLAGCLGANNVGNAFTPHGDGDPLQLACWGAGLYHAGTAADAELLYECVSDRARRAVGLHLRTPPPLSVVDNDDGGPGVPLPGLLVRNVESVVLPGPVVVPARQRLSVRDVVWDPPDSGLRSVVR